MNTEQTTRMMDKPLRPGIGQVCETRPTMEERLWVWIYKGLAATAFLVAGAGFCMEGYYRWFSPARETSELPVAELKAKLAKRDAEIGRLRAELRASAASREVESTTER